MDKRFKDYGTQVVYRPIEAAIRWSGLLRQERHILKTVPDLTHQARSGGVEKWPQLAFNIARLFDGLVNGELPYGENGVTRNDPALLNSPHLTIRHLDLRTWMHRYYPEEKPAFLFDEPEDIIHAFIDIDTVRALLAERDCLRTQVDTRSDALNQLRGEHQTLRDQFAALSLDKTDFLHPRGESTYLNIIGALISLLLDHSPGGTPYSVFKTQESLISALVAHHSAMMGLNERTLQTKFAEAKRRIASTKSARP